MRKILFIILLFILWIYPIINESNLENFEDYDHVPIKLPKKYYLSLAQSDKLNNINYLSFRCSVRCKEPNNFLSINKTVDLVPQYLSPINIIMVDNHLYKISLSNIIKYKLNNNKPTGLTALIEYGILNDIYKYNKNNLPIMNIRGKLLQKQNNNLIDIKTQTMYEIKYNNNNYELYIKNGILVITKPNILLETFTDGIINGRVYIESKSPQIIESTPITATGTISATESTPITGSISATESTPVTETTSITGSSSPNLIRRGSNSLLNRNPSINLITNPSLINKSLKTQKNNVNNEYQKLLNSQNNIQDQPEIQNKQITDMQSPDMQSPDMQSLNMQSLNMQSPNMQSPDMQTLNMQSPNMQSPNMQSPNMQSPNMQSPNMQSLNMQTSDMQSSDMQTQPQKMQSQPSNMKLQLSDLYFDYDNTIYYCTSNYIRPYTVWTSTVNNAISMVYTIKGVIPYYIYQNNLLQINYLLILSSNKYISINANSEFKILDFYKDFGFNFDL